MKYVSESVGQVHSSPLLNSQDKLLAFVKGMHSSPPVRVSVCIAICPHRHDLVGAAARC